MTEKKLQQVRDRLVRINAEQAKANTERLDLERLRDYQAAHPLLCQPSFEDAEG